MKLDFKTRILLAIDNVVSGLVSLISKMLDLFDKIAEREAVSMTDEELHQEQIDYMKGLNESNVPDNLKGIFPLAKRWGIGDDALRGDLTIAITEEEKAELTSALNGKLSLIDKWLDSFSDGVPMSDEAAAFMYLAEAVDELDLDVRYE